MLDFREFAQQRLDEMWESGVPLVWPVLSLGENGKSLHMFYWRVHDSIVEARSIDGYNPCFINDQKKMKTRTEYFVSRFSDWPELHGRVEEITAKSKSFLGLSSRKISRYSAALVEDYINAIPKLYPNDFKRWYLVLQNTKYYAYHDTHEHLLSSLKSAGDSGSTTSVGVLFPRVGEGLEYPQKAQDCITSKWIPNDMGFVEVLQNYVEYDIIREALKKKIHDIIVKKY